ncbi:MAG: tetratricopeptide repeat protein, partial [Planctomycetota bacterium]
GNYVGRSVLTDPMVELAVFYGRTERWADVVQLIENAPYWGVADLQDILLEQASWDEQPLAVYVAQTAREQGQSEAALRIVEAALLLSPGEDALYALLLELDPEGVVARLDELFARDRFEERPLIWKAKVQLDAGDPDTALETIRRAIRIDPSDGEQGPGDRMRAYSVLADILRIQGDDETAALMEGAVKAIRLSEAADEFDRAGLLSRAVEMYQKSLTLFADAYCIQSRLAIQLSNLGRYDEAAKYYERAYELMPDSFGRVESHCFGCEGAFTGERAQSIAERVFERLVRANPLKPQVYYLRGYLNSSRNRAQDALADYRKAVELDPDYLNAWKRIQSRARSMQVDRGLRDRATLAIFRLDPLGRHSSARLADVRDLAAAWRAVDAAQPLRVEAAESLLPLPTSEDWLEGNRDPYESQYAEHRRD